MRWPGFVAVANNTRGARFVVPTAAEIERIHAKYSFLTKLTVPAGQYQGQYDPIATIGSWGFVMARADLEDSIGHRLASSLYKIERAGTLSKLLAESTARNTLATLVGPEMLPPGVARFYKEAELLK